MMPPALDTPEEVAAMLGSLLGLLATFAVGLFGALAIAYAAWTKKLKPLLTETREAARSAAHELTNNSGGSTRDAVDRIETIALELREDNRQVRREIENHRDYADRNLSEIFRRIYALESANREID
ncbi:hypothetical protein [Dermabacter sp. HMSC06F07]|uniref:hypothetical protein n=1 Tax=Dermabacter sp. HMSC06F07 TaxID=1581125 RepID=UPI00114D00C0|nr:hypothetical protein [Dermabacter sp. HMSC06F07]